MKNFWRNYSIHLAVLVIILLSLISAFSSFVNRRIMLQTSELKNQIEQIRLKMQSLHNQGIKSSDLTVRQFALIKSDKLLQMELVKKVTAANYDTLRNLLKAQNYDFKEIALVRDSIFKYFEFQEMMLNLVRRDSMNQFKKLFELDLGTNVWSFYNQKAIKLYQDQKKLFDEAQEKYLGAMNRSIWVQVILVLICIPTLLFIINQLNYSRKARRRLYADLNQSVEKYLYHDPDNNDQSEGGQIIQHTIRQLQNASDFVNQITQGNFEARWNGLDTGKLGQNETTLAGALVMMKDHLQQVKKEEENRNWENDGLAYCNVILRKFQQSPGELTREILSFLTEYLKAQYSALFLIEKANVQEEAKLVMKASFALNKQKFIKKEILPGEGFTGEAFASGQSKLIQELPENFIPIQSALLDAKPASLLIVPLKYNQKTEGVVEFASLQPYSEREVQFLEKAGEYIAATFGFIHLNK